MKVLPFQDKTSKEVLNAPQELKILAWCVKPALKRGSSSLEDEAKKRKEEILKKLLDWTMKNKHLSPDYLERKRYRLFSQETKELVAIEDYLALNDLDLIKMEVVL